MNNNSTNILNNIVQFVNIFPNVWVFYLQTTNYEICTINNINRNNSNDVSINLKRFCK